MTILDIEVLQVADREEPHITIFEFRQRIRRGAILSRRIKVDVAEFYSFKDKVWDVWVRGMLTEVVQDFIPEQHFDQVWPGFIFRFRKYDGMYEPDLLPYWMFDKTFEYGNGELHEVEI